MGYRSEVKIAMKLSDYEEMMARLDYYTNKEEIECFMSMSEVRNVISEGQKVVIIHWDWVKWYTEYKEVQYIEEYLGELSANLKPYKFVRIGEESTDVEVSDSWGEDGDDCCDIIRAEVYAEIVEDI